MKQALVLLSGGLDSAVCAWWASAEGYQVHALSFAYGQRHTHELQCAAKLVQTGPVQSHQVFPLGLDAFGGSSLTDATQEIPVGQLYEPVGSDAIPNTYVPMRNLVFLSVASALAEARGYDAIVAGVNAVDYSGYPDCRPDFVQAFAATMNLASARVASGGTAYNLLTPLLYKSKPEIIRMGVDLQVPFALTNSCYKPDPAGNACCQCDSCRIRAQAFRDAGMQDPAIPRESQQ